MKTTFLIAAVVLTHGLQSAAQSISLVDIDTSAYPTMRAKFYAFDAQGNQQRPAAGELTITENGQSRTISSVTCPPPPSPRAVSTVLVTDVSGSMGEDRSGVRYIDLARAAARAWIQGMPTPQSECALTSFDDRNDLVQDFTTDRQRLLSAVDKLIPRFGTNYDVALMKPMAGGLVVSAAGRYRRVVILLTDGLADPPDVNDIVANARKQDCLVFCVTLGMSAPQSLHDIAIRTGGQVFENVTTVGQAEAVYRQIMSTVLFNSPCTIEWQSGAHCQVEPINVTLGWQAKTSTGQFAVPPTRVASVDVSPSSHRFDNPPIGTPVSRSITVTARNQVFAVTNITMTDRRFSVTPTSFTLQPNESKTLTLTFTATDSGFASSRCTMENASCPRSFIASRYTSKDPTMSTLKVTHPNGGEAFVIGSDTVITWEGIPATEPVRLDYSTDGGATWKAIDTARGQSYRWVNIPPPASSDCRVRVRQMVNAGKPSVPGEIVVTLAKHTRDVASVSFSPDGMMLASGGQDDYVRVWDPTSGQELYSLRGTIAAFSPDGNLLATPWQSRQIRLWDPFTRQEVHTLGGHSSDVLSLAFSPDGRVLASGSSDRNILLWDPATGQLLRTLAGHSWDVKHLSFSPDGTMLASGSDDGTVKLWNPTTGQLIRTLPGNRMVIQGVVFSPNGTVLATASFDKSIKLWDPATGKVIRTMKLDSQSVTSLAFSPDGGMFVTGCDDGTIRVWNPAYGQEVWTLRGHQTYVSSLAFSSDGSILASASYDNTVKLWYLRYAPVLEDRSDAVFSIVEHAADAATVDMKQCLVGASRDSVVANLVRNTGTVPFDVRSITFAGADASAFSMVSGKPVYSLSAGTSRFGEIRFRPSRAGLHQAQMVIITPYDTLVRSIRGTGVDLGVRVVSTIVDFGRIPVGSIKDTVGVLTVRNDGRAPITISGTRHAGPNDADFTTIVGGGSFVLQPGETRTMDVRFTANRVGRTSGTIAFDYGATGSPAVIGLFADVYDPNADTVSTTIAVDDVLAQAGEAISIRLRVVEAAGQSLTGLPQNFTAVLSVNPSVVTCMDTSIETVVVDSTKHFYVLSGTRTSDSVLATLPAIATLGTTDVAPIELYAFQWTDPLDSTDVRLVSLRDGSIRITGICDSGGVRLYVPSDAGFSLASRPNPAGATVDLHFGLAGAGPVSIDIIDQTGRVLMSPVSETRLQAGVYTRSVDLSPLSNGPYMLMLRSGNSVLYSRMDVVR